MSRCPICDLKLMNCDCTEGDKKAYALELELESLEVDAELIEQKAWNAARMAIEDEEVEAPFYVYKTFEDWKKEQEK